MDQQVPKRPQVVQAAPNESQITARVLKVTRSEQWPDKWLVDVEFIDSRQVQGPNFAKPGQRAQAFAFGDKPPAAASDTISARAEYIGDARGGQYKLSEIAVRSAQMQLRGTIQIPAVNRALNNARVHVTLEDVSLADAPSTVVAHTEAGTVSASPGESPTVSFSLPMDQLQPSRSYSVRVHVDVDGDGTVSPGDYITTQSYPVTRESISVSIMLRQV